MKHFLPAIIFLFLKLFKMSYFLDNPVEILNLFKEFSDDQLQVLFGDSENFNNWFKEQNIIDKVFILIKKNE